MRRLLILLFALLLGVIAVPAHAQAGPVTSFELPPGFQPEGIAAGPGPVAYFGSRATGAIYRADLRTGEGSVIAQGTGTSSLGMKTDHRGRLFVAGGPGADGKVYETATGRLLASYRLVEGPAMINDVLVTRDAAYFTDSTNPALYKLPLGRKGELPAAPVRIPLSGDIVYGPGFNANGITPTPDGRALLVVQSNTAKLFRVDPATGAATAVDLGGEALTAGDGLLLSGRTLYAVQNRLNTVAVFTVARDGRAAKLVERRTDPRFDVPTTVAAYGKLLYLPNARFSTPPTPTTTYTVVGIPR
ncbi:superoxide dismutase [Spongiactinospora sp. TRM90649]|uniref:superoxide dismutase n=1 Tax=Spongiactinospora sp. TRM90649 TaxID=3031114 RepID=UPI0023FA127B|nr:superoxide dismutase [Spongiactinospora sp. TRM90649]MDF5757085.1 superoxide dismutase [Spongiactinospora sp. TRM90649]